MSVHVIVGHIHVPAGLVNVKGVSLSYVCTCDCGSYTCSSWTSQCEGGEPELCLYM